MGAIPERIPPGRIRLTYDDYLLMPDDGRRYEILDGEIHMTPAPSPKHQAISRNLARILDAHVVQHELGSIYFAPIDVVLDPGTVVQPDLLFIAAGRESIITARAIEGAPDLVVEILSPSSAQRDRVTKAALYARFGVPHYWIVDPDALVLQMYEAQAGEYRLVASLEGSGATTTTLFPGLEIDLGSVWA